MGLVEFLGRLDPRRKLRLQFEKVRSLADALAAERDAYLQQRDQALGERNEILRQRDVALGERNELRRQLDTTMGERDEVRHQLDVATGERNELRRQLDIATGERNELRRQLDIATGEHNELRRQLDIATGEHNELRQQLDVLVGEHKEIFHQRDQALGERNELLRQRDETLGERNDMMRQRDHVVGQKNLLADRWARYAHRSDVIMRPSAGTRDRLLLFLHLARTGGVTLSSVFARNFATEEFLQIDMAETEPSAIGTWSHTAIERALARLETSEITKLRAIWGHYRHGIQELLPKPCAVVTLLRDPVDRVLSGFYYSHRSTNKDLQVLDDDLAQSPHHVGLDNSMTRVINGRAALDPIAPESDAPVTEADFEAAVSNLHGYLLVGTTDQFDQTLLILGSDLCWSLSDLVYSRLNVAPSRPAPTEISEQLREKILNCNRYDAVLVECARAHLARRIATYRGDFARDLSLFRELNSLFQRGAPTEELRRIERDALCDTTGRPRAGQRL